MDFNLSKEQEMLRRMLVKFSENEVAPLAAQTDETGEFPAGIVNQMARYGLLGIPFPTSVGGAGGDELSYAIAVEELSKKCASTGVILSAHTSLGTWPIYKFGTEKQKEKYLRKLCSGEWLGAFGLTEPSAGTDAAAQQTKAFLDGEEYVLNGSKIFITNGGYAHVYIIFAMTDKSKGTRGISAFIVENGTQGFSIGKKEKKLGIRGSATTELVFENCRIPKSNLLGEENKGFKIAMATLDGGRIGIAAQALGIAQGALDATVKYVKEREQFGRPIAKFQGLQWMIAEMEVKTEIKMPLYKIIRKCDFR